MSTPVDVFFYGSYMNRAVLREVALEPARWTVATLRGFTLVIAPRANLVRADAGLVWGFLARATHAELARLYAHAKDVLGEVYLPEPVVVETNDGRLVAALCYICPAMEPRPAEPAYVERILAPARDAGFPGWYLEHIRACGGEAGNVNPTRAQFDAFKALPRDRPIHMLNLIRLRERARYDAGQPEVGEVSGADAYRAYGRESAALFQKLGGRIVWAGRPEVVVTGPEGERWDLAFIAEYPSAAAFLAMVKDPDYAAHVRHRSAAVEDSRLIRMSPLVPGEGFGEET